MAWTDDKRAKAIESYTKTMQTEYDNDDARAAASVEVVKEIAEDLGETSNGVRLILSKAGVYIKGSTKSKSETKAEAAAPKRISKADALEGLKTAIQAIDPALLTDEGSELIDKMTAKAAAYFTEVILTLTKE